MMAEPGAHEESKGEEREPSRRRAKRAVLVIHGMGDQSPMETLRGFVDAVWTNDPQLTRHGRRQTWSKPDAISESRELRRITTSDDRTDTRTDFFEFYWAHMMEDTQLASVISWFKRLFLRPTGRVPPDVMAPWRVGRLGIVAAVVAFAACLYFILLAAKNVHVSVLCASLPLAGAVFIAVALWWLRHRILVQVVGDAARYLTAAPQNIGARSRIRAAGLEILRQLHEPDRYDRIIVVCHSLGTVVGYDLLSFYWSDVCEKMRFREGDAREPLLKAEEAAAALRGADAAGYEEALAKFRAAQGAFAKAVADASEGAWKVTDFVTLGCPLTHAHFLLVDDGNPVLPSDLERINESWLAAWHGRLDAVTARVAQLFSARAAQREFPLCPPLTEKGDRFSYELKSDRGTWVPHHAALFGAVRWTNIFAPRKNIFWGDVIAGPLARLFGPGIKDVELKGAVGKSFVAHTRYWEQGHQDREHLEALRAAANLLGEPQADAWKRYEKELAKLRSTVEARPAA